jgi:hypothetical protein
MQHGPGLVLNTRLVIHSTPSLPLWQDGLGRVEGARARSCNGLLRALPPCVIAGRLSGRPCPSWNQLLDRYLGRNWKYRGFSGSQRAGVSVAELLAFRALRAIIDGAGNPTGGPASKMAWTRRARQGCSCLSDLMGEPALAPRQGR